MAVMTYREALNLALREEMKRDDRVFVIGEEVGLYEGAYKVTQGLLKEFGPRRIVDTPIAESGFTGVGIGAAMVGLRPVVEMMTFNFALLALDQIVNSAAKMNYMSGGQYNVPIVIRGPGGPAHQLAAQHSQSMEVYFYHVPGLKVVRPSTPADAKGLLKSAIRDDNPVIFIESETLYDVKGEVPEDPGVHDPARAGRRTARGHRRHRRRLHGHDVPRAWRRPRSWPRTASRSRSSIRARCSRSTRGRSSAPCARPIGPWWWRRAPASPAWAPSSSAVITEQAFDDLDAPVERVTGVPAPDAVRAQPREGQDALEGADHRGRAPRLLRHGNGKTLTWPSPRCVMPKLSEADGDAARSSSGSSRKATASRPATSWPRSRPTRPTSRWRRSAAACCARSSCRPASTVPVGSLIGVIAEPERGHRRACVAPGGGARRRRRPPPAGAGRSGRRRPRPRWPSRPAAVPAAAAPRGPRRAHAVPASARPRRRDGAGRRGAGDRQRGPAAAAARRPATAGRVKASPLARKIAAQSGVDLQAGPRQRPRRPHRAPRRGGGRRPRRRCRPVAAAGGAPAWSSRTGRCRRCARPSPSACR